MSTTSSQIGTELASARDAVTRLARRAVLDRLRRLAHGRLVLQEGEDQHVFGERSPNAQLTASVHVRDAAFFRAIAFGGSVGAGESYARGEWATEDLTAVVRMMIRNRDVLDGLETGWARLAAPVRHAARWLTRNTRAGSRRNIRAHYDLGNEFFAQFLDRSMMYSSAIFESDSTDLHCAQLAKMERICRKLELRQSDHLLEIGSGWGALAIHAASEYGCRVTTTTISPAQYALARERIAAAGLSDRVELVLRDYRDLDGTYDKIVSVEMIEAIGHRNYAGYFRKSSELLKPDGMMLLQAITIADHRYEQALRSVDFIQRHIFPGSTIPSIGALCEAVMHASDLRLFNLEDIGPHYARTLRLWREQFHARRSRIRALGYSSEICNLWDFYFSYCEGGFEERVLGDVQMLLVKPANRRSPILTRLRDL